MAEQQLDSTRRTFRYDVATFEGSAFDDAATRLGAGQSRWPDTPVYQRNNGCFFILQPLNKCFDGQGNPATNRGTWGSRIEHWKRVSEAITAEWQRQEADMQYFQLSVTASVLNAANLLRQRTITRTVSADPVKPLPAAVPASQLVPQEALDDAPGDMMFVTARGVLVTGVPQIAEYNHFGDAGRTIQLTGQNLSNLTVKVLANGKLFPCDVIGTSGYQAQVQLPANLGTFGGYLLWVGNDVGYATPLMLNRADAWWAEDKVVSGQLAYLYGENLAYGNVTGTDNSYVLVQSGHQILRAQITEVKLGRVQYRVPAGLPDNSDIQLLAHNGHGGPLGFGKPLTVTVVPAASHIIYKPVTRTVTLILSAQATNNNARTIQDACNAASSQPAGTFTRIVVPAGRWYLNDAVFLGSGIQNWELFGAVDGQGKPATFLTVIGPGTVPAGPEWDNFGAVGSTQPMSWARIQNIQLENENDVTYYDGDDQGNYSLWAFKQVSNFAMINCGSLCNKQKPLNFQNDGEYIYIRNNLFRGVSSFTGQSRQVWIQGNRYEAKWNADSVFNTSGLIESDTSHNVLTDFVVGTTDLANCGVGRFDKTGMDYGSSEKRFIGYNTGLQIGPQPQAPDQNQGEIILCEGAWETVQAKCLSAQSTPNKLKFGGAYGNFSNNANNLKQGNNVVPGKHLLRIINGAGLCQMRGIVSNNGSELVLDVPLDVMPDDNSLISIGLFSRYYTIEGNHFTGRDGVASRAAYNTSCGVDVYGGAYRWNIYNNLWEGLRIGCRLDGTQEVDNNILPLHFIDICNNKGVGNRNDVRILVVNNWHDSWVLPAAPAVGLRFSFNDFSAPLREMVVMEAPRLEADRVAAGFSPVLQMVVFEGPKNQPVLPFQNLFREYENGVQTVPMLTANYSNLVLAQPAATKAGVTAGASTSYAYGPWIALPAIKPVDIDGVLSFTQPSLIMLGYEEVTGDVAVLTRTPEQPLPGEEVDTETISSFALTGTDLALTTSKKTYTVSFANFVTLTDDQEIQGNKRVIGSWQVPTISSPINSTQQAASTAFVQSVIVYTLTYTTALVYRNGQSPFFWAATPLFNPYDGTAIPHDLLVLRGKMSGQFAMRFGNFKVSAHDFVVGDVFPGARFDADQQESISIDIAGITVTGTWSIYHSNTYSTRPLLVTVRDAPYIGYVGVFQYVNGSQKDVHRFINCNIGRTGRSAAYNGQARQTLIFERCNFGDGIASGEITGTHNDGDIKAQYINCIFRLNGTAVMGAGGTYDNCKYINCIVVTADGTITRLDNQPTTQFYNFQPVDPPFPVGGAVTWLRPNGQFMILGPTGVPVQLAQVGV